MLGQICGSRILRPRPGGVSKQSTTAQNGENSSVYAHQQNLLPTLAASTSAVLKSYGLNSIQKKPRRTFSRLSVIGFALLLFS